MSDNNPKSSRSAPKIPRQANNYTPEAVAERQQFVHDQTQVSLDHVGHASLGLESLAGNIENYIGVAQVPIGLAGPLRINGQHAQGDFYIPMATTEGTLVAIYSRGMRV